MKKNSSHYISSLEVTNNIHNTKNIACAMIVEVLDPLKYAF